ncbi:vitamin K epoxide reductase family protein [Candidatus Woesearchaeota archaeon]|nr:vitamin K epoxide reductase family protein [Candidatus Woesearchaeota archaeon]
MKFNKYYFYTLIVVINIILSLIVLLNTEKVVNPEQCFINGGCIQVQNSIYSSIFGIPLVYLGIIGFSFILLGILFNKKAVDYLILIGGLFSIWLIYVQVFVLRTICKYCITIDILTIIMMAVVIRFFFWKKKNS